MGDKFEEILRKKSARSHAQREIRTFTDIVFHSENRSLIDKLESHRIEFEKIHGPTDLTKHYTSMLPDEAEEWLLQNDPHRWYDGLPPFVQSYIDLHMRRMAGGGQLDAMSNSLIKIYFSRKSNGRSDRDGV